MTDAASHVLGRVRAAGLDHVFVLAPYLGSGCGSVDVMAVAASTEAAVGGVAEIAERLRAGAGTPRTEPGG